ncbi:hypothetical protein FJU30_20670 [Affinibrenneria salicis]|uniref:Transcriptional regulator n=1 Tax=Affinibrenneria salicis TaxID=2590031 RepID=A0A5J5FTH1_9GAMM|nr:PAS domain-containing protein [Affinibrenneria salicis]KAA8996625.1 hypothetical protein FJU30_20670 [Affinibrenneria salicis]
MTGSDKTTARLCRDAIIGVLRASMAALRQTVTSNTEIVLHDLTRPEASVIDIINGHVSDRQVGDALLSGPDNDNGFAGLTDKSGGATGSRVFSDYYTKTHAGKRLNSSSTLYYDEHGNAIVAFCINVDMQPFCQLKRDLDQLAGRGSKPEPATRDFSHVVEQTIQQIISSVNPDHGTNKKQRRMRLVAEMNARGIFKMKGGVNFAAKALGVTRYTIYNYLDTINDA